MSYIVSLHRGLDVCALWLECVCNVAWLSVQRGLAVCAMCMVYLLLSNLCKLLSNYFTYETYSVDITDRKQLHFNFVPFIFYLL